MKAILDRKIYVDIKAVSIARDTDAKGNDYVGWGYIEGGTNKNDNYIGIFVAPHKRRKGIGTGIVKELLKKTKLKSAQVQPHDKKSEEFYRAGGYRGEKRSSEYDVARVYTRKYDKTK